MGYTHYYYQKPTIDPQAFIEIGKDFEKMISVMDHLGVKLGDYGGQNVPLINAHDLAFNGLEKCGHEKHDIGLAWPSQSAKGVKPDHTFNQLAELTKGNWFAGRELETRVCGGDCSYETFAITQQIPEEQMQNVKENGYSFNCTKTNYKPYDLAVNVVLIIAKHHLKNDIVVYSDGDDSNWIEGVQLVQHFLGYGEDFKLDPRSILEDAEKAVKAIKASEYEENAKKIDMDKIEVGDILERSWGYDQTNVTFVKVVEVSKTGKSAKIIRIGSKQVEAMSSMSGQVIADPSYEYPDQTPQLKRVKKYSDSLYLGEYHKWDGRPCYTSSYA